MELTVEQALQQGVAAFREGKLQDAERLYRAILQSQPLHPDANHNLGVVAVSLNNANVALPLFRTALEANPKIEQFWLSYIDTLIKEKQLENAKIVLEQGRKSGLSEDKVDALEEQLNANTVSPSQQQLNNLLDHYQNQRHDDAEKLALLITRDFPNHQFGWKVLGAVLKQTNRIFESLVPRQKVVELDSLDAEAHNNLGITLQKLGRLDEAEASYRQAIALGIGYIEAHRNLANILRELGRIEQAIESDRYAIFLSSAHAEETELEKGPDNLSFKHPSPIEYPALYRAGMGTENVGGFLRAMAHMLRPKNILEIGAGYTTPFLLEALINNERVYDDGNLKASYFKNYIYESKLVVIDNCSLGELSKKPGMEDVILSKYTEFIEGNFEGKAELLHERYGNFDFVWFDCGGAKEYKQFIDEYWDICSDYIFFHFTYTNGSPNKNHDIIRKSATGNLSIFDIVEPHKSRQGSITMVRKII